MRLIDAAEYKIFKQEFEKAQHELVRMAQFQDRDGAWARAMIEMVPAFLHVLEAVRKQQIPPRVVLEGLTNLFADLLRNSIRVTMTPAERLNAFDAIMRHFEKHVRPQLVTSAGGIILPGGLQ